MSEKNITKGILKGYTTPLINVDGCYKSISTNTGSYLNEVEYMGEFNTHYTSVFKGSMLTWESMQSGKFAKYEDNKEMAYCLVNNTAEAGVNMALVDLGGINTTTWMSSGPLTGCTVLTIYYRGNNGRKLLFMHAGNEIGRVAKTSIEKLTDLYQKTVANLQVGAEPDEIIGTPELLGNRISSIEGVEKAILLHNSTDEANEYGKLTYYPYDTAKGNRGACYCLMYCEEGKECRVKMVGAVYGAEKASPIKYIKLKP